MTDRINHLSVTLTADVREDDCEYIINAIRMIKGVLDVSTHIAEPSDHIAELRAKAELQAKLRALLD